MLHFVPTVLFGCTGASEKFAEAVVLTLGDANSYTYDASLTLDSVPTAIGVDLTFRWDALTEDMEGDPIESCDEVDFGYLISFPKLTHEDLEMDLLCGELGQRSIGVIVMLEPEEEEPSDCEAQMSEFALLSDYFDPATEYEEGVIWLAGVGSKPYEGRMLTSLVPSAKSTNTEVVFENDSTVLAYTANLQDLERVAVPAAASAYSVDWSAVTAWTEADRCESTLSSDADQLWLARYDTLSVGELEAAFPDLDEAADAVWTADMGGLTRVDLADAVSEADGSPFVDFSGGGTWVLALRSTVSASEAPGFLTILAVE